MEAKDEKKTRHVKVTSRMSAVAELDVAKSENEEKADGERRRTLCRFRRHMRLGIARYPEFGCSPTYREGSRKIRDREDSCWNNECYEKGRQMDDERRAFARAIQKKYMLTASHGGETSKKDTEKYKTRDMPIRYPDDGAVESPFTSSGMTQGGTTTHGTTMGGDFHNGNMEMGKNGGCMYILQQLREYLCLNADTYVSHTQTQLIAFLLTMSLFCLLGILAVFVIGHPYKMAAVPTWLDVDSLQVGEIVFSDGSIKASGELDMSDEFTLGVNDETVSVTGTTVIADSFVAPIDEPMWLGTMKLQWDRDTSTMVVHPEADRVNMALSLNATGSVSISARAELAGLVFQNGGCDNCNASAARVLEMESNVFPFDAHYALKDAYGKVVIGDEKTVCKDGKCVASTGSIPASCTEFVTDTCTTGKVISAKRLWDDSLRRIVLTRKGTVLMSNGDIVREMHDITVTHSETIVDMNGQIWDVIVDGANVFIFCGSRKFTTIANAFGEIKKLKVLVNSENEILVFVLTDSGVASSVVTERAALAFLTKAVDFGVSVSDVGQTIVAIVDQDGHVFIGRSRNPQCTGIHFRDTQGRLHVLPSFFAVTAGNDGLPVLTISDGMSTYITRCTTPLCYGELA